MPEPNVLDLWITVCYLFVILIEGTREQRQKRRHKSQNKIILQLSVGMDDARSGPRYMITVKSVN